MRVFDCKVATCREALREAPRLRAHLCGECLEHHRRVEEGLKVQGLTFVADDTLVRGLDYYTRTTFEFQSSLLGAQSGVGGGGRYDGLIEAIGGPSVPGVGFGTGIERILLALSRSGVAVPTQPAQDVYLVAMTEEARGKVFRLAHEIRAQGGSADLDYMMRSAKGQMKQAGKSGARYAFIVGEQELAGDSVTVRDLRSGGERLLPSAEAVGLAGLPDRGLKQS